jgi:Protein phosphatase 2C
MSAGEWRVAAASVAGAAHARSGAPCQDASRFSLVSSEGGPGRVLAAVVADGAGSACRAEAGSRLACAYVLGAIEALLSAGGGAGDVDRGRVEIWLASLRTETERLAADEGLTARDYASTLLAAVVGEDRAAFFQVGDGAMVIDAAAPDAGYECVFWPQHEEYENITFFAAEPDASEHLLCAVLERRIGELAMFSDGLQRLALDFAARRPHPPFFRSMLSPLRDPSGGAAADDDVLSGALAAFLDSPRVNARTEDDKTLVLAVRGPAEPPAHSLSMP